MHCLQNRLPWKSSARWKNRVNRTRNAHGKRRNVKLQSLSRNPESRSRVSLAEADDFNKKWSMATLQCPLRGATTSGIEPSILFAEFSRENIIIYSDAQIVRRLLIPRRTARSSGIYYAFIFSPPPPFFNSFLSLD